jgi:acyl-CoA thioesterase YciA
MRAEVRNIVTRKRIMTFDTIAFVNLGSDSVPSPHGFTAITYDRDRIPSPGSLRTE